MSSEHYFSEAPGSDYKPKEIQVEIDGRPVSVLTAGGVFSPDHIDTGTQVLLDYLDEAPPAAVGVRLRFPWRRTPPKPLSGLSM
jgi:16S rRNA G1207 methylase RsmC